MPKKSITPFTYYTFRFDYQNEEQLEKIKTYILGNVPKYAIFREISDVVGKPHIQGKVGIALSDEQLRKNIRAALPNMFIRSNYTIAAITDSDLYDSYICKDGVVFMNNVFTSEYILEQVEIRKQNKVAFETKIQKAKSAPVTFTHSVFVDFCKLFPHDVTQIQLGKPYNASDYEKASYLKACNVLLSYILKRLGKIAKVFDDNVLQRMYNGIKNSIIELDDTSSANNYKTYENRIVL